MMSYNPNTQEFTRLVSQDSEGKLTIDADCVVYKGVIPDPNGYHKIYTEGNLRNIINGMTESICGTSKPSIINRLDMLEKTIGWQAELIKKLEEKINDLVLQVEKLSDKELLI